MSDPFLFAAPAPGIIGQFVSVLPASSHFLDGEKPNHIIYWIGEFGKPFSAPSTVEIATQMARSIFDN
ncbi:MAG: hypothetical protein JXR10_04115 [Cyclobacteriaceae bacterium]